MNYNLLIGLVATTSRGLYVVKGWYLDSNGCVKTHDGRVGESFVDMTYYSKHNDKPQATA